MLSRLLQRMGKPPQQAATTREDEVVQNGCYHNDRAGQQRISEGLAGIKELGYCVGHIF